MKVVRVHSTEYVFTRLNDLQWRFADTEEEHSVLLTNSEYTETVRTLTEKGYVVVWPAADEDTYYFGRVFEIDPDATTMITG